MRSRLFSVRFYVFVFLVLFAGCERHEGLSFTAEIDEPSYRRAKELLRQGRDQEALNEFHKVIEKRGTENSPESHLELGLLYQQHIHDPVSAIYYYRRYRELKPQSTQAPLVAQRIDAATREFALTIKPPPPDNQLGGSDMTDVLQRLQQDNEQLKSELASARANLNDLRTRLNSAQPANGTALPSGRAPANTPQEVSPISAAPAETSPVVSPPAAPVRQPGRTGAAITAVNPSTRPSPAATPAPSVGKKHVVAKGDTLMNIAQHYYGNRSRYHEIFNANRDVMKSENDVRIGMELKIP